MLTFLGSCDAPRPWEKSAIRGERETMKGEQSPGTVGYTKLDRLSQECTGDRTACRGAALGDKSQRNLRQAQIKQAYPLSAFPSTYENGKPHNENEYLVKFTARHEQYQGPLRAGFEMAEIRNQADSGVSTTAGQNGAPRVARLCSGVASGRASACSRQRSPAHAAGAKSHPACSCLAFHRQHTTTSTACLKPCGQH